MYDKAAFIFPHIFASIFQIAIFLSLFLLLLKVIQCPGDDFFMEMRFQI